MKRIYFFLTIIVFTLTSCTSDSNDQTTTSLEGNWLLQNIPSGSRINFTNNNFTIKSGTVTIQGTFTLTNNQMYGQVITRSGANSAALQPDNFTGKVQISNNEATFTEFDGNWRVIFSTWYVKQ